MGFLRRDSNAKPDYTALQLNTSASILPIPIVWGLNRVAPNVIWYQNFTARAGGSGKGFGGKGGLFGGGSAAAAANNYTYYADVIMALCEGPLSATATNEWGVGIIWKDLSIFVPIELGLGVENGSNPQ